jgi:GT2 family glycosyltransferase
VIPTLVHEVEMSGWFPDVATELTAARVLVRLHGAPLGFLEVPVTGGVLSAEVLRERAKAELPVAEHLAADGLDFEACRLPGPWPVAGPISVVLCTRDREELLRAALTSVLAACDVIGVRLSEVVVVDNAPRTTATRAVVQELNDPRLHYVLESRPGLSIARNTGARASTGTMLAFTDDDVIVDGDWLDGLLRGFSRAPRVGCVTGLVPTAELDTDAQHFFDRKVRWSSACEPHLFDLTTTEGVLYPYSAGIFGTGANFAVTREAYAALVGFDEALGAGAPTRGGEDLDWFVRTLNAGFSIAYEPSAIVWHRHRRDMESLADQLYGYGTGFTAYLLKQTLSVRGFLAVARRILKGLALMSRANEESLDAGIDPALLKRERIGMLHGPFLYAKARWSLSRSR